MTFTYAWTSEEQNTMLRTNPETEETLVFYATEGTPYYEEFLSSGVTAATYVAPPGPEPLTAEQKLEQFGLTVEELKGLLGL